MKIVIAPCERRWFDKLCAKCFPYWDELVPKLEAAGHHLIQISQLHQTRYTKDFRLDPYGNNLPIKEMERILREEADMIVTIDSFFQHLAHLHGKHGVVIFSKSKPNVFGYPENINLLKDEKFLRPHQFGVWKGEPYEKEAFVSTDEVLQAVERYGKLKKDAI